MIEHDLKQGPPGAGGIQTQTVTAGVFLGVMIGMVVGVAFDDISTCVVFGLGIGIAIASAYTLLRR